MFLALVHLRDLACAECGAPLAAAGSRSVVVGEDGLPVAFDEAEPGAEMAVDLICPNGHDTPLAVPADVAAEQALQIPDGAPFARDAVLLRKL